MFRLRRKPVRLDVAPSDRWPVYEIRPRERGVAVLGLLRKLFRRRKSKLPR